MVLDADFSIQFDCGFIIIADADYCENLGATNLFNAIEVDFIWTTLGLGFLVLILFGLF